MVKFLSRGAAILVCGAALVLAGCAGAPAELDDTVVVGKMTAAVPSGFERWELEDGVSLEDPSDPGSVLAIDFLKGSDASVGELEEEQVFLLEGEFDLEPGDELSGDEIDAGKIDGREYRAIEVVRGFDDYGPKDDQLRLLLISAPEGAYVVTFQGDAVDVSDFIEGISFSQE